LLLRRLATVLGSREHQTAAAGWLRPGTWPQQRRGDRGGGWWFVPTAAGAGARSPPASGNASCSSEAPPSHFTNSHDTLQQPAKLTHSQTLYRPSSTAGPASPPTGLCRRRTPRSCTSLRKPPTQRSSLPCARPSQPCWARCHRSSPVSSSPRKLRTWRRCGGLRVPSVSFVSLSSKQV
jgi:hypothetical protein